MITLMNIFGIFVGAVGIEAGATPSEIWDFWIDYFRNLWWCIKKIAKLIFKRGK